MTDIKQSHKAVLRKDLRQRRVQSAKLFSSKAKQSLHQTLKSIRRYRMSKHIGIYLPFNNEFPVSPILQTNLLLNKNTYIPRITSARNKTMEFVNLDKQSSYLLLQKKRIKKNIKKNIYGIEETAVKLRSRNPKTLDIIFVPLLGFNKQGTRLGMGGGYYDRLLSFKKWQKRNKTPLIIGLAFESQYQTEIKPDSWDIPLDMVITEEKHYTCKTALL